MRVNPFIMPVVLIAALLGTVYAAQAMGHWSTSGRTAIDPSRMTAADLKGWMTLQQVIDGLQVPKDIVYDLGKIPADVPTSTALKDLEKIVPDFETSTLRDALTARLGTPAASSTVQPTSASAPVTPIVATPNVTPMPTAVPTTHASTGTGTGPTPLPPGQVLPADEIKGRMTLQDVSQQCAVPLDKVISGLKLPADTDPNTAIKDLIAQGKIADVTDVQQVVAPLQTK